MLISLQVVVHDVQYLEIRLAALMFYGLPVNVPQEVLALAWIWRPRVFPNCPEMQIGCPQRSNRLRLMPDTSCGRDQTLA